MTLDRQSIEKRDFPIARRGYDPAGVDAHLARIADELEQMRREAGRAASGGVAGSASTHVQSIVEAAESTAEQLLREAQGEAAELRERAAGDAQRARQEALEESRDHVAKVSEAATRMMQRVEAMDGELGSMLDGLRTGANRLVADLALLEGNIADLHEQHGGVGPVVTEPERPAPSPRAFAESSPPDGPSETSELRAVEATGASRAGAPAAAERSPLDVPLDEELDGADGDLQVADLDDPQGDASPRDQEASARLIALDLALGGASRDEVKAQVDELFDLTDVDRLLDDVFASIDA